MEEESKEKTSDKSGKAEKAVEMAEKVVEVAGSLVAAAGLVIKLFVKKNK